MYLSRVEIDVANRQKIKDLSHLGAYHNWVEQSFPREIEQYGRLRHLWRIDTINEHNFMLLLSPNRPDLQKLEMYGVPGSAQTVSYDKLLNSIEENQIRPFRITANPSYDDSKTQRRFPHITSRQKIHWFLKRTEKHGFVITKNYYNKPNLKLTNQHFSVLHHDKKTIRLSMASFEGTLKITNKDLFKETLIKGFGHEKAYGMGLLTVMPTLK